MQRLWHFWCGNLNKPVWAVSLVTTSLVHLSDNVEVAFKNLNCKTTRNFIHVWYSFGNLNLFDHSNILTNNIESQLGNSQTLKYSKSSSLWYNSTIQGWLEMHAWRNFNGQINKPYTKMNIDNLVRGEILLKSSASLFHST